MAEVKIERNKCKGCRLCIFYCPAKHLEISSSLNDKGGKFAKVKENTSCTGCGICFLMCPDNCIEVFCGSNSGVCKCSPSK